MAAARGSREPRERGCRLLEPPSNRCQPHKRSNGTFAVSFRSFLVRTRKEHVSPLIKEKDMSFSHRRENDEKSRRDSRLGLSSCYWEAYTHGSKGVAVLAELAQATTRRAESHCCWKLRARRRKSARIALTARSACSAVDARVYECKHVSLPCIFLKIHRTESKE